MNNELMHDKDFIRCSTIIAELLMKYKSKESETKKSEEPDDGSSPYIFLCFDLINCLLSLIIMQISCPLLTIFYWYSEQDFIGAHEWRI